MQKIILVTGSTDGIGLATAEMLVNRGHSVLLHGRNPAKLKSAEAKLSAIPGTGRVESYIADLSNLFDAEALVRAIERNHDRLDVLINNAGIFRTSEPITASGLDVRFAVNTIAPYLLTQQLLPLMDSTGRIINLSSAAQSPVNLRALTGQDRILDDLAAYAQSKLAITMWSRGLALRLKDSGPVVVAVNPGSMLGSKMVTEGFGVAGGDIRIGAEILTRAALSDEFESATGKYFDNDAGQFASPHSDALDSVKIELVVHAIESIIVENRDGAD